MDYWVRLNKAIDVADECLRRRGRNVDNSSAEVVMMFISHCPDPRLAMSFQLKPSEQWTAAEVQERLDSYQRDLRRSSARSQQAVNLSTCSQSPSLQSSGSQQSPVAIYPSQPPRFSSAPSQYGDAHMSPPGPQLPLLSSPVPMTTAAQGPSPAHMFPPGPQPLPLLSSPASMTTPAPGPTAAHMFPPGPQPLPPPVPPAPSPTVSDPGLHQVAGLLDRMLSLCSASLAPASLAPARAQPGQLSRPNNQPGVPCKVCGDGRHSTYDHCRQQRLCRLCFRPGHFKASCPSISRPSVESHLLHDRPAIAPSFDVNHLN